MSDHGNHDANVVQQSIKDAIVTAIPDAVVEVVGGGGHYAISVCSAEFVGKRSVQQQRLVYQSIAHLMAGDAAPVHAVDMLKIIVPES